MISLLLNPTLLDPTSLSPPNGRGKLASGERFGPVYAKRRGSISSLPLRVDYRDNFSTWSGLLTTVPTSTELYISKLGQIKEPM